MQNIKCSWICFISEKRFLQLFRWQSHALQFICGGLFLAGKKCLTSSSARISASSCSLRARARRSSTLSFVIFALASIRARFSSRRAPLFFLEASKSERAWNHEQNTGSVWAVFWWGCNRSDHIQLLPVANWLIEKQNRSFPMMHIWLRTSFNWNLTGTSQYQSDHLIGHGKAAHA